MTQMNTPFQDQSEVKLYQEPDRTSIMAILSMVFGIGGCCLGITSIPAILLGVLGLVGVSRSKGRVGGSGFAIAGILIGLLTLALWIGLIFGGGNMLSKMMGGFGNSTEQMFLDLQSDSFDSARGLMSSPASNVTDEEMVAFREAYRSTLGDFVSKPNGLGEIWSGYGTVIQQFEPYSGRQGYIPLPMRFDSGMALVIYVMDVQSQSSGFPPPIEYIVIDQQGNEYHLPMSAVVETAAETPELSTEPDEPEPEPEPSTDTDDDKP